MNEIGHKIGIAVKKDCQVTISSLLQHMLGFKRAIFSQARSRSRLGGRRNQGTKVSVRVLPTGRTENGGRRSSTNVENRTGRRKRRGDDDQSFRSRAVLSSGSKTFSDRWNRYKGWHRSQNTIRARTRGGDTSLQKEKGVVSRMKQPHHCQAKAYHDYYLHQAGRE